MSRLLHSLVAVAGLALAGCASGPPTVPAATTPANQAVLAPVAPSAFWDCIRESGATLVSAHRGGPGPGFAENALPTLRHTLAQGAIALEVDIRQSRDGVLVLMHDETLERTSTGRGRVADLTAADLARVQLRDPTGAAVNATVPTLAEALALVRGRALLQLDVKRGVPFEAVVAAVRAARAERDVIVIVYNLQDAITVHRLDPRLMLSVSIAAVEDLDRLANAGVDQSRVLAWTGTRAPDPALNQALAERGIEVLFGTLGGSQSLDQRFTREGDTGYRTVAETGVHVIATDRPLAAYRALNPIAGPAAQCNARR